VYDHALAKDVLQKFERREAVAAEMANTKAGGNRQLPAHQRGLQHPPPSLISELYRSAGVRSKGGIMRKVIGAKPLQVQNDG